MRTTTAAIVESGGAGFELGEVTLDDPRPDEVLVRMVATGICHTDLGAAAGALPFPLPGVLGHEGAGVVEEVGAAVTHVAPGDQVLCSFDSCGACTNCRGGHPAYCDTWLPRNLLQGTRPDGTATVLRDGEPLGSRFFGQSSLARHAVVAERSVVPVPDGADLTAVAPIGCGVVTGFGAAWHTLDPSPGDVVLVAGAGAVGLSAVMALGSTPASRIVAVDRVASRLELARELGATDTIDTSDGDEPLTDRVMELTGGRGVDGAIDTTGSVEVLGAVFGALALRGSVVNVGAPPFGTTVEIDVNHMMGGRRIEGVTLGDAVTSDLVPQLVRRVADGRLPLDRLVTRYGLDDVATAVQDMHSGATIKPVIVH